MRGAVFNLKCSALEMKPGHLALVWEPKSTTFTAGSQTAGIDSSIFENGCCPQQGKAKLEGKTTSCQINGSVYLGTWELQSMRHKV